MPIAFCYRRTESLQPGMVLSDLVEPEGGLGVEANDVGEVLVVP